MIGAAALSWEGLTNGDWAEIIVAVLLVAVPALAYQSGRLQPLKIEARSRTLPREGGGSTSEDITVVTVTVRSRTKDIQTIRSIWLVEWPPISERFMHPRWRARAEGFRETQFDSTSLPVGGLEVPGKDTKEIKGTTARTYPPYASTRLLLEGIRQRPWFVRIQSSAPIDGSFGDP